MSDHSLSSLLSMNMPSTPTLTHRVTNHTPRPREEPHTDLGDSPHLQEAPIQLLRVLSRDLMETPMGTSQLLA